MMVLLGFLEEPGLGLGLGGEPRHFGEFKTGSGGKPKESLPRLMNMSPCITP